MYKYKGERIWCTESKRQQGFDGSTVVVYYYNKDGESVNDIAPAIVISLSFPFKFFLDSRNRKYYGHTRPLEEHCNVIYRTEVFRLINMLDRLATIRSHDGKEEFRVDVSKLVYAVDYDE